MFLVRQPTQKRITTWMNRNFGGGHQHFKRAQIYKKSENTVYHTPVEQGDLEQEYGKKGGNLLHHRVIGKLNVLFGSSRIQHLDNARTNKYSLYHWAPKIPFLKNGLSLRILASLFDNSRQHSQNAYDEPVQIHENSVFLYQSPSTPSYIGGRVYDYVALSFLVYGT